MQTGSYVNGDWYHPKSPRLVRNLNPADPSDVLAEFPSATAADTQPPSRRRRTPSVAGATHLDQNAGACSGAPPRSPAAAPRRSPAR